MDLRMEVCDLITTPSQRPRNFAVVINVIEAKNLAWQHSDSYVSVKIGSEFRLTQTQRNTSRPFFNEVLFLFCYFISLFKYFHLNTYQSFDLF